jgi:hypothetical protein
VATGFDRLGVGAVKRSQLEELADDHDDEDDDDEGNF